MSKMSASTVARRPLPPLMAVTDAAAERLRALYAGGREGMLLRVSVSTKGCSGMSYVMDFVPAPGPGDEVVTETAGEDLDLGAHATPRDLGGPGTAPREEATPRWRRPQQRGQAPPGDGEPQAGAEPVAEPPDEGRRRERD